MSKNTLVLVHEPGRIFETHERGRYWEGPMGRLDVAANTIDVNLALAELCCILPPLSPEEPGRYPIFAVEAVEPCEPGRPSGIGAVLLRVAYEPFEGLFHFGMNAGTRQGELEWLSLGTRGAGALCGAGAQGLRLDRSDRPLFEHRGRSFGSGRALPVSSPSPWPAHAVSCRGVAMARAGGFRAARNPAMARGAFPTALACPTCASPWSTRRTTCATRWLTPASSTTW